MNHSALNRLAFRVLAVLAGCLLLATAWAPAASATPACPSGSTNLATLISTYPTCDIGSLQFTFGSLVGYGSGATLTAGDFNFSPVSHGFTLSLDGGQSVTAAVDEEATDGVALYYSVSDLDGNLTGESAVGEGLSATGTVSDYGLALSDGQTTSSDGSSEVYGYSTVSNASPVYVSGDLTGSPFSTSDSASSLKTYAEPFALAAC
jgi:hypothetical protein